MKRKMLLPLATICCLLFTGCKKDNAKPDVDSTVYGNNPRTAKMPDEVIGRWQYGVFSMTQYNDYKGGGTSGAANETSVTYQINADGTGTEFFYSAVRSYYTLTETLGKRYGTFTVDEQGKKLTFYASSGSYYLINTVSGGSPKKGEVKTYAPGGNDLYPKYKPSYPYLTGINSQGKRTLSLTYPSGSSHAFVKMD